ncbi:hypothetical protein MMC25_002025 [Agyrium rufum]|nr:hypothetical protein [Agyrium rufum]
MSSLPMSRQTMPSFFTRIFYDIGLFAYRILFGTMMTIMPLVKPPAKNSKPTLIKSYPSAPQLKNRVFYPPNHTSSSPPLPLFLSLHGGGFAFGDPMMDDGVSSKISTDWNVLVISLSYLKGPVYRYPKPTQQLVASILSILEDESLPFDRNRIALGGFSAGGGLSLSACQEPELKGRIHAVVTYYPVTDFTTSKVIKRDTRPYRHTGEVDSLLNIVPLALYAYVPEDQDLRAPGLSPLFAARKAMPEYVCTVGAEYDIFCNEAGAMMGRFAGKELVKVGETEGLNAQDREGFEAEDGKLKWVFVKGAPHGFTHGWGAAGIDPETLKKHADETFRAVGEWLFKGPFQKR